jgi:hypothetical protein
MWKSGFGVSSACSLLLVFGFSGCANPEATRASLVAANRLRCDPDDMSAGIERSTPVVREWIVGCDFTYTRVHCTDQGCTQAPPVPPCVSEDMPCMVEDPVTLKWVMLEDLKQR